MEDRKIGIIARMANDRDRVAGIPEGFSFEERHKSPRFQASAAVIPVVIVEFLVAGVSGVAIIEEPGFSSSAWFPALWAWIFLVVLHRQLLLLRLPLEQKMVTADYRDALAKRSTYAWILVIGILMVAVFSVVFGWPITLSGVAAILGLAGFLDLLGRDAAKFDSARLYAAKRRFERLAEMEPDLRAIYLRSADRFGVPHVNGLFGPIVTAIMSGGLGLLVCIVGKYGPRVPDGEAEPLTVLNYVTIAIATVSLLLLLLSWAIPNFEIGLTGRVDRFADRVALRARSMSNEIKSAGSKLRNRRSE